MLNFSSYKNIAIVLFVVTCFVFNFSSAQDTIHSELGNTYISNDESIQFNYPDGWFLTENSFQIILSDSESGLLLPGRSGTVYITFFTPNTVRPFLPQLGLSAEEDDLEDILDGFGLALTGGEGYDNIRSNELNGYNVAIADVNEGTMEGTVVFYDLGNSDIAIGLAVSAPDEYPQYEDIALSVLSSVTVVSETNQTDLMDLFEIAIFYIEQIIELFIEEGS